VKPTRRLSQIKIGDRHRKDFGDLHALAGSIDREGLLQPVAITPADELIAGERRIRAWPLSKFRDDPIPVHVVDIEEIVRGEWSENSQRKDFTPSEMVALKRVLEPKLREEAKERQGARTDLRGISPDVDVPPTGRAADKVAAFVGRDRKTIGKAEAVVEAAEAEPEKYGRLVDAMDRTGQVNGPFKRLQVMKQSEALRVSPPSIPMRGPYRCAVIDYPWPHEPEDEAPGERGKGDAAVSGHGVVRGSSVADSVDPGRRRRRLDVGHKFPHAVRIHAAGRLGLVRNTDHHDLGQGSDGPRPDPA
jgi:ParB-like chromosome segregation protein Spo0J